MTEHTPAPWTLWHNEKGGFTISDRIRLAVLCQRNDWDKRAAESIANARLIAAAPDMLAALRELADIQQYATGWENGVESNGIQEADYWHAQTMERVKAAIAKAEGHPSR